MSKYLDKLKEKGSNTEKEKQFEHAAALAKLQWEANLLETRSRLASAKVRLEELKSAQPLSAQRISDQMDEVEALEKGEARLVSLQEELF